MSARSLDVCGHLSAAGRPRGSWSLEGLAPQLAPLHVRRLHLVRALPYLTQTDRRVKPATQDTHRSVIRGTGLESCLEMPGSGPIQLRPPTGTEDFFLKDKSDGARSLPLACI